MDNEKHYVIRGGWIRAAILGANDGILSTSSLIIGVAAASTTREPVIIAGIAGLVAGALSMAAGEYVSVSSQSDIENSDLERERMELSETPKAELRELSKIYEGRGLDAALALQVAEQLTAHNALEAHARDELGINEMTQAQPLKASLASGAAFLVGGVLPVILALVASIKWMIYLQYTFTLLLLVVLGIMAAKAGGSEIKIAVIRITFWGTVAMGVTALIGYLFGVSMV